MDEWLNGHIQMYDISTISHHIMWIWDAVNDLDLKGWCVLPLQAAVCRRRIASCCWPARLWSWPHNPRRLCWAKTNQSLRPPQCPLGSCGPQAATCACHTRRRDGPDPAYGWNWEDTDSSAYTNPFTNMWIIWHYVSIFSSWSLQNYMNKEKTSYLRLDQGMFSLSYRCGVFELYKYTIFCKTEAQWELSFIWITAVH